MKKKDQPKNKKRLRILRKRRGEQKDSGIENEINLATISEIAGLITTNDTSKKV